MKIFARCFTVFVPLLCSIGISAQQAPLTQPSAGGVSLDVVVTPKSGPPESGLEQKDFTVLDDKVPQTLTAFQAVDGRQAPIEVILLIDAVNIDYPSVAYEREQIDTFLRADKGRLAHPTALAVLTDAGLQFQPGFSTDGNVLSASLDQYTVGLRRIPPSTAFYGAVERFQLSLDALRQLAARETPRPGRKLILWVSPGWPLLSGPEVELDAKQQQEFFDNIVNLSTALLQARITLYSLDPLGSAEAASSQVSYWQNFLKGVSKPSQVKPGNLALEVLATQSGGAALSSSNDITAMLRKCLSDTRAYYEVSFDPPLNANRDEYHRLEIKLTDSRLTARTRTGYYAHPDLKEFRKVPLVESAP